MYNKTTEDVTVTVEPVFLKEGSRPGEDMYLWAYRVRIENNRPESVHLRRSYWCITDSLGQVQEVTGIGVLLILSLTVFTHMFESCINRMPIPKTGGHISPANTGS